MVSWFWGCCKRREYLKSLARRLGGLEKLRISLEKDVSIIKTKNDHGKKKQRGVMFEHNVYNQFIPTPAQAEQNCNIMTFQGVTLRSFSSCKNSNQTIHYKQTIQHHIITKECLLASKRFFVEGTIKKDAQELQMYNKHSLGKLFILLICLIFEWRTRRL